MARLYAVGSERSEFASFYVGYVSLVPETDVLPVLENQVADLRALTAHVDVERETFRYAPGKWSIRELVGHMVDAERVFGYRAFCISRGEQAPLPGFDENDYVATSGFNERPVSELLADFTTVREANLAVFRRLTPAAWKRVGNANGHPVSVLALAFIMAGHDRHHWRVLGERYGVG
jgi:hypothetical protein